MATILRRRQAKRAVTMQDIADRCGVSRQTVSRSFVDDPRISDATRQRVLAMAAEMGYDPLYHQSARRMSLMKTGQDVITQMIGIFFPPYPMRSQYADDIFWGCWDAVTRGGFSLALFPSCDPATLQPAALPQYFRRGDVDGLIVLANPYEFEGTVSQLQSVVGPWTHPIVFIVDALPGHSAVLFDDQQGAYLAVQHLLSLGHRQLLHFYPEDHLSIGPHAQRRLAGYQQACREANLVPHQHLHALPWRRGEEKKYLPTLINTLKKRRDITAILARNDQHALDLIGILHEHGWRVPDDYSIIGFDDTEPFIGPDKTNWLTTIRVPLREVGRAAGTLLIDEVIGKETPGMRTITLATELMIRRTTIPPCR